jgi:hypothetical protein
MFMCIPRSLYGRIIPTSPWLAGLSNEEHAAYAAREAAADNARRLEADVPRERAEWREFYAEADRIYEEAVRRYSNAWMALHNARKAPYVCYSNQQSRNISFLAPRFSASCVG